MSEELAKRPEEGLTTFEREEWMKWKRSPSAAPLAISTALKMYELYLLGHSCDEIYRANENRFPLGLIIDARVRFEWDKRREAYLNGLFSEAGNAVKQRQIESAMFLGDVLAAAHKQHGDKFKKFLQTGDVKDLPDEFKITSITMYKMAVDALMKVTGLDQKTKNSDGPSVQVIANNATLNEAGAQKKTGTSGEDAFTILKRLSQLDEK